jgi:hypothetical protein
MGGPTAWRLGLGLITPHHIKPACYEMLQMAIDMERFFHYIFFQINKDGSFLIKDIQHSDEGNYSCAVENEHGKDEIVYSIKVRGTSCSQ